MNVRSLCRVCTRHRAFFSREFEQRRKAATTSESENRSEVFGATETSRSIKALCSVVNERRLEFPFPLCHATKFRDVFQLSIRGVELENGSVARKNLSPIRKTMGLRPDGKNAPKLARIVAA